MMHAGEPSWTLKITITDLQRDIILRVNGDQHIGSLMVQLAETAKGKDWADHAFWWPERNIWLNRTRSTLNQIGLNADCELHYTPMHRTLWVQLPDLNMLECRINFSIRTFAAVQNLCKQLNIRHAEELSFCMPLERQHLKHNCTSLANKILPAEAQHANSAEHLLLDRNLLCPNMLPAGLQRAASAPNTPKTSPYSTLKRKELRPRTLLEKARLNVGWLDSSLSLYEQHINEQDTLWLRFKYYVFYDLNAKQDAARITQLYEQAKCCILHEELDCNTEQALMFAALQYHIEQLQQGQIAAAMPEAAADANANTIEQDIESALSELTLNLEGPGKNTHMRNITHMPELSDILRLFKPCKFTLKCYKRYFFICKELQLHLYAKAVDVGSSEPLLSINLFGCKITTDVKLEQEQYIIRLEVPNVHHKDAAGTDYWLRCDTEQQYAKWLAAIRLASKGRSLADSSYDSQVASICALLQLQRPSTSDTKVVLEKNQIVASNYLPLRALRKFTDSKAAKRILQAQQNVHKLALLPAMLQYIEAWQSLPNYGITFFVIRFDGQKKDELLGVAYNCIMRMDLQTGDHIKTWFYRDMISWNINWGVKCMMIEFPEEKLMFSCLTANCKVVHEFIGGYIFMSMRNNENSQILDQENFHKLTAGWD